MLPGRGEISRGREERWRRRSRPHATPPDQNLSPFDSRFRRQASCTGRTSSCPNPPLLAWLAPGSAAPPSAITGTQLGEILDPPRSGRSRSPADGLVKAFVVRIWRFLGQGAVRRPSRAPARGPRRNPGADPDGGIARVLADPSPIGRCPADTRRHASRRGGGQRSPARGRSTRRRSQPATKVHTRQMTWIAAHPCPAGCARRAPRVPLGPSGPAYRSRHARPSPGSRRP